MYETLMTIPLFKGVSHEQISAFLEKTPLHFNNFQPGETLIAYGEECRNVTCLLSGKLQLERRVAGGRMLVRESLYAGSVIGLSYLFGLDTHYHFNATALTQVGIMEFSKDQLRRVLESNPIYLINCLNYLARRGQKCDEALPRFLGKHFGEKLGNLMIFSTDSNSREISVTAPYEPLWRIFESAEFDARAEMRELSDRGIISIVNENKIEVLSRSQLLEITAEH